MFLFLDVFVSACVFSCVLEVFAFFMFAFVCIVIGFVLCVVACCFLMFDVLQFVFWVHIIFVFVLFRFLHFSDFFMFPFHLPLMLFFYDERRR